MDSSIGLMLPPGPPGSGLGTFSRLSLGTSRPSGLSNSSLASRLYGEAGFPSGYANASSSGLSL